MVERWNGARVPVTLLGGVLGAGKTTLLNRLLTTTGGHRLVVMVNDVGDIAVDAGLIASATDDVIELTNGCVCCSIGDGLGDALEGLRGLVEPPDQVVIELSGVAEPARVAPWASTPGFRLDAIVVCADAEQIERQLEDRWLSDTVRAQLRAADLVVLTKTDLVDDVPSLAAFTSVPVVDAATVPLATLLSVERDLDRLIEDDGSNPVAWLVSSVRLPHPVDPTRLLSSLADLPSGIIRLKGFVSDGDRTWLVQGVGERRSIQPVAGLAVIEPERWGVVAIATPDTHQSDLDGLLASLAESS